MSLRPATRTGSVALSDDQQLMAEVQAGDLDAFGELYDRYCARAYRLAQAICRDDGRAEEAVQEGFISIWRSRASYRPERASVAAWLMSVIRFRAIDATRRNNKHLSHATSTDWLNARPAPDDTAAQVAERAEALSLKTLLAKLPNVQREVIALAFYCELTHTEIADRLGLPPGTVKGRMRLGLHRLREDFLGSRPV